MGNTGDTQRSTEPVKKRVYGLIVQQKPQWLSNEIPSDDPMYKVIISDAEWNHTRSIPGRRRLVAEQQGLMKVFIDIEDDHTIWVVSDVDLSKSNIPRMVNQVLNRRENGLIRLMVPKDDYVNVNTKPPRANIHPNKTPVVAVNTKHVYRLFIYGSPSRWISEEIQSDDAQWKAVISDAERPFTEEQRDHRRIIASMFDPSTNLRWDVLVGKVADRYALWVAADHGTAVLEAMVPDVVQKILNQPENGRLDLMSPDTNETRQVYQVLIDNGTRVVNKILSDDPLWETLITDVNWHRENTLKKVHWRLIANDQKLGMDVFAGDRGIWVVTAGKPILSDSDVPNIVNQLLDKNTNGMLSLVDPNDEENRVTKMQRTQ